MAVLSCHITAVSSLSNIMKWWSQNTRLKIPLILPRLMHLELCSASICICYYHYQSYYHTNISVTHPKNKSSQYFGVPSEEWCSDWAVKVHGTHNVSRLLGRRLGALLSVDAYEVRQGGTAGEQRGGVAAEEGQQHLFKQQRNRDTFDTADGGVRQLRRGRGGRKDDRQSVWYVWS